jgi:ketosteroid isomerase-like protein
MDTSAFSVFLEHYHRALGELINGRPELYQSLYSRRDDATLANPFAPFGPVSRGYGQISETIGRAASNYVEGQVLGFDNFATVFADELAYIVEVERFAATIKGRSERTALALRVTTIVSREKAGWKVVHRQADPITAPRPAASVLANT